MKGPKDKKTSRTGGFTMPGVDVAQLERLLDFMAAHGLEEFEYEHGGLHIRLKKASAGADSVPRSSGSSKKTAPAPVAAAVTAPAPEESAPETPAAGEELHTVKSPIVGTFYAASSPEAPPFIKIGDAVRAGQVVCIIEAMKLMNEIEADIAGKVERVLVENGQPVEYGQPLFAIRPGKK